MNDLTDNLIKAREALIDKLKTEFFNAGAAAAHLLGSLANGKGDEFSDVDIWVTFDESVIEDIVSKRLEIFSEVGNILIFHETKKNGPVNGSYTLLIYEVEGVLIQVDVYISPLSTSRVAENTLVLFENKTIERGNLILDLEAVQENSLEERIDFLICMCFIGIKKVIRKDSDFMNWLLSEYNKQNQIYNFGDDIKKGGITMSVLDIILDQLNNKANEKQRNAINKIKDYMRLFSDVI